MFIYL